MNKTSIEYCDYTSNPVTGCTKGCSYCYARRLARGRLKKLYLSNPNVAPGCDPNDPFSPRLWPDRLREPLKQHKASKIFMVDMGDLWDPHIPDFWIDGVLAIADLCQWHTFQFLTKQSGRAARFKFPSNAWVGITIEDNRDECLERSARFSWADARVRFISYEPLLGPIASIPGWADWIIIGAMTGRGAIKPDPVWVEDLIGMADEVGMPVFLKDNLDWLPRWLLRQEFPK